MTNEEIQPLDNAFVHGSQEQVQPTHEQSSCTNPVLSKVAEIENTTSPSAGSVCSDIEKIINELEKKYLGLVFPDNKRLGRLSGRHNEIMNTLVSLKLDMIGIITLVSCK